MLVFAPTRFNVHEIVAAYDLAATLGCLTFVTGAPADLRRNSLEQACHAYRWAWRTPVVRDFIVSWQSNPKLLKHAKKTWPMPASA